MHLLSFNADNYSPPAALTSNEDWLHKTISRKV